MNTPGLRNALRIAAHALAHCREVCAEARECGDDAHRYNADTLERLAEDCLAEAVEKYLNAVAGWIEVRELRKL